MATFTDIDSTDDVKILHDGSSGDGGIAKCGTHYRKYPDHSWIKSNKAHIVDNLGKRDDRKLCEDCFVGDTLTEFQE